MSMFSDKTLRWLAALLTGLAIYFLASAFFIPARAMIRQCLLESAWQRTLAGEEAVRPWPWAAAWPVARMKIPQLGVDLILMDDEQDENLVVNPVRQLKTFHDGSLETIRVCTYRNSRFHFLRDIQLGQHIFIQDEAGEVKHYQVEDIEIVDARNLGVQAPGTGNWLTLVTKYPFDNAAVNQPLQYIVFAEAVPATEPDEFQNGVSI